MTDLIMPTRRSLLAGLACLIASPAIVRASSLMPMKALAGEAFVESHIWIGANHYVYRVPRRLLEDAWSTLEPVRFSIIARYARDSGVPIP